MPRILRWLTWMCFASALFVPLALIPSDGAYINEQQVTFEEFWRRGGGPIFLIAGLFFPVCGYGFVHALNWARFAYVGVHAAIPVISFSFDGVGWDTFVAIPWLCFLVYYLFRYPPVQEYFACHTKSI